MSSPELTALLVLQDIDLEIDRHRHRRETLPERAELAAVDAETASVNDEIARLSHARDQIAARESEVEAELVATEARAQAVSRRLYGGEVSASRELQAMAADVESLKGRASDLEDRAIAFLEEREPLDTAIATLEERRSSLASSHEEVAQRLEVAASEIDAELGVLEGQREGASSAVGANLLATYERLRKRLGGIGAARLVGNHCDGCHLALSSAELQRVRRLPDGEVATCEQCSRILVP
jgi:uncharacterized protein